MTERAKFTFDERSRLTREECERRGLEFVSVPAAAETIDELIDRAANLISIQTTDCGQVLNEFDVRFLARSILRQQIEPLRSQLITAQENLDFLSSKGITAGPMKEAGKEPYLAYVIRPGSELDDMPTMQRLLDAEIQLAKVNREFDGYLKALAESLGMDMENFNLPSEHGNDRLRRAALIQLAFDERGERAEKEIDQLTSKPAPAPTQDTRIITARRFFYPDSWGDPEQFIVIGGKYYPLAHVTSQPPVPVENLDGSRMANASDYIGRGREELRMYRNPMQQNLICRRVGCFDTSTHRGFVKSLAGKLQVHVCEAHSHEIEKPEPIQHVAKD